jgi:hypothetical protein
MRKHLTVALGIAAIAFFCFLPSGVQGARPGLRVTVYNYSDLSEMEWPEATPWRRTTGASICKRTTVSDVNDDWGAGEVFGCQVDDVAVRYYGYLRIPRTGEYTFKVKSDDGFVMTIGREKIIDDWVEQSATTYNSEGTMRLRAGVKYPFEVWWYENSGVAVAELYYSRDGGSIELVPGRWFSQR